MENPIILITSSEEGGGNGSRNTVKGREECEGGMRWRSKLDEYRMISDLSGFENVKAMIEAEAFMRRKKRNRTKKRKFQFCGDEYRFISDLSGFENLKAMIEAEAFVRRQKKKRKFKFYAPEDVTVNAGSEKEQPGKDEAVEIVEASKPESVQVFEINESQNFVIDSANKLEDTGTIKVVETTEGMGIGTDDRVNSSEVIDLCSSSSEANRAISDMSFCRGVEDTMPAGSVVGVKKRRRRRKMTKMISAKDNVDDAKEEDDEKDNIVLRRFPRKPRYFDPLDCSWVTCSNCGKENHTAARCKAQRRKKACFLCGSFKHVWKYCRQGQDCFSRKEKDHLASDCPETNQGIHLNSNICLRCGDSGHDMFSCSGDYFPDDLKEIRCYICQNIGHLCCVNFPDMTPKQISCYNCGESGHSVSECKNSREAPGGRNSSVTCFKCGEEGYFARRCGSNLKDRLRISDIPHSERLDSRPINAGSSSTHLLEAHGKKNDRIHVN